MNTFASKIDARQMLSGWLNGLVGMFSADINGIPEEKWSATFGGCTKPASALAADAISLLIWTTSVMKGETPAGAESLTALESACATRAGTISILQSSAQAFDAALNGADEEFLMKPVMAPWGMESPLFQIANIAVSHIWYHDGQLNYIHCLLGDNKIYWMGG